MFDLVNTYKVYIFAFLVCALLVVTGVAAWQINHLNGVIDDKNDEITSLTASNALLAGANKTMAADIDTQNKAVSTLRSEAEKSSKEAAQALDEVRTERNKWRDRYAVLFGTPEKAGDTCGSLTQLIEGYYSLRKEEQAK